MERFEFINGKEQWSISLEWYYHILTHYSVEGDKLTFHLYLN